MTLEGGCGEGDRHIGTLLWLQDVACVSKGVKVLGSRIASVVDQGRGGGGGRAKERKRKGAEDKCHHFLGFA